MRNVLYLSNTCESAGCEAGAVLQSMSNNAIDVKVTMYGRYGDSWGTLASVKRLDPLEQKIILACLAGYGSLSPTALVGRITDFNGISHEVLCLSGAVLERIVTNNFSVFSPFTRVLNDGTVTNLSGSYAGATVAGRVSCPDNDHTDIWQNTGGVCSNGKSVFASVTADLLSLVPRYAGSLDAANCASSVISGWAWNSAAPSGRVTVEILADDVTVGTVTADQFRQDLVTAHIGDGYHSFSFTVPASLKDGKAHSISIRVLGGGGGTFWNSPRTMTGCATGENYLGYIDVANCETISGWAADLNNLNTSVSVELWDSSTLVTTIPASQNRSDVGTFLQDNGNHGFSIATPASLKNGASHSLTVKFAGASTALGNSPRSLTCSMTPQYIGYFDGANCSTIEGWAADTNNLNTSINVELWDGSTLVATAPANQSRPDVGTFLHDNGSHGFSIATPASLKNGAAHSLTVKFAGTSTALGNSPKSLTCSVTPQYIGYFDGANCNTISGWAADTNNLNTSINVELWDGSTLVSTIPANQNRSDVGALLHDNGNHGFSIATPASLKNGSAHSLTVKFAGTSTALGSSPKSLTCSATPQYVGYFDVADCSVIKGWAADTNNLNTSLNVELWDSSTLVTTIAANQYRADVGTYLHDNGNHGFNIATPASLIDGEAHSLMVNVAGTSTALTNSPRSITCAVPGFNFTTTNGSKSVQAGQQVGFDLSLTPVNNFTYPVTVFVSGLPASTSVVNSSLQFSIGPTSGANFTLSLQTTGSTPAGNYTLTLQAQGGGMNKYLYPALTVTAPPPLFASCFFSPNPIALGDSSTLFARAGGGTGGYLYSLNGGSYQWLGSTVVWPNDGGSVSGSVTVKDSNNTTASNTCSLTVNGVAPRITAYSWDNQPVHGVNFSGYIYGSAFTPSSTVYFYGPGCTSGCQQDPAGVTVQSLYRIRVVNVRLGSGSYQVEIRTAYGSSRSGSFTVN